MTPDLSTPDEIVEVTRGCEAILLDLNKTFAFDCDRLDAGQDFGGTYRGLGGSLLEPDVVRDVVQGVCAHLHSVGRDAHFFDSFPSIEDVLLRLDETRDLPKSEHRLLADVIGRHEVGEVPPDYAAAVKRLATRFCLGLVSNVWADRAFFVDSLDRAEVREEFEVLVFSSDHGVTKPSALIFQLAMDALSLEAQQLLYVGNSYRRDVVGARNAGLSVVWINAEDEAVRPEYVPDAVVGDFREFVNAVT